MNELDFNEQAVLAELNELRAGLDMEPISEIPKGRRYSSRQCPIAQALTNDHMACVGGIRIAVYAAEDWLGLTDRVRVFDTPPAVKRFIKLFDQGYLREYNEDLS